MRWSSRNSDQLLLLSHEGLHRRTSRQVISLTVLSPVTITIQSLLSDLDQDSHMVTTYSSQTMIIFTGLETKKPLPMVFQARYWDITLAS
ncbi:hypothetical protein AUEXF2481DRAFT_38099 [Aureobasidium subglaciale EXF-2481]|uniref:Uncharacterized protein n=1 Tax=Aureobasidium subglaciale (strain EXF-2481) TaxID=1043005 RepID=A0A074YTY1_AURSE|nr:uncharacterized protein AUEXF2481DRAFT_38099 [Aureobasidium subglaciale EXF-2481]KEQ97587.1 hypothetical protein AUEXF2481DRAFT_38099 [Aureobasidium subglaciale EXF-2481]